MADHGSPASADAVEEVAAEPNATEKKSTEEEPETNPPVLKKPSAKNPPKAKAKAVAKAKSTANSKGKAKGKGKTKGGAKSQASPKKSAKPDKKKNTAGALKRPAAAGAASETPKVPKRHEKDEKESTTEKGSKNIGNAAAEKSKWQVGLIEEEKQEQEQAEEEEGHFEDDQEVNDFEVGGQSDDTMTVRCKKQKFMKMLGANQLPSFLVSEWRRSETMKVGRVDLQRKIINACFDRNSSGKLMLALEKPMFESIKKAYTDKSSTAASKSLPRSLFQGKFGLSDAMFERGLAEGDFQEVKLASGAIHYSWETSVHKVKIGDLQEQSASNVIKGQAGDAQKFVQLGQSWRKGLFDGSGPASSSPAPMALQDAPAALTESQWTQAQSQLKPAQDAFDKVEKDGLRMLQVIGVDNKSDSLYPLLFLGSIL